MSYFDRSDAEGVDFGDWVEEHEEERRELASLEAACRPCEICLLLDCECFDAVVSSEGDDDMEALLYACGMCSRANVPVPDSLCAECKRFDAAHSGEGDDMGYHDDKNDEAPDYVGVSMEQQQQIVNDWIDGAPVRELKRIKIRCDTVVGQRRAALEQESKELASWEKPHRETRSDKGTKRAKENAA